MAAAVSSLSEVLPLCLSARAIDRIPGKVECRLGLETKFGAARPTLVAKSGKVPSFIDLRFDWLAFGDPAEVMSRNKQEAVDVLVSHGL
jgi:hypothetical protein